MRKLQRTGIPRGNQEEHTNTKIKLLFYQKFNTTQINYETNGKIKYLLKIKNIFKSSNNKIEYREEKKLDSSKIWK